jgi:hypothetical protein
MIFSGHAAIRAGSRKVGSSQRTHWPRLHDLSGSVCILCINVSILNVGFSIVVLFSFTVPRFGVSEVVG